MRRNYNLFDVLQNNAIGIIAIHSFILGYKKVVLNKHSGKESAPSFSSLFYVLPIVYGESSLKSFKSSFELYTALSKDRSITLGLQERAQKMSAQTLDSINLGFSKNIFIFNEENQTIDLSEKFNSISILNTMKISTPFLKEVRTASFRLGNIFAKKDDKMLQITMNIRF
ncbi:MAG: three component ABC system middle component [Maribacter sp.]|uniref:three component ABC system middle component n=1 Tax=Maribacter sp. TaxID=1897614 RepID=UPI0032984D67